MSVTTVKSLRAVWLCLGCLLLTGTAFALDYANFVTYGYEGKGDLEFLQPEDLVLGPKGEIVVADTKNNRIQILTPGGRFQRFITWNGPATATKDVKPAPDKDKGSAKPPTASATGDVVPETLKAAKMDRPMGLALDREGNLFVGCAGSHQILVFRFADGKLTRLIGKLGSGQGDLREPADVDVAADGKIAVADQGNRRVQVFDSTGKYLMEKHYREETKKKELRSLPPRGVHWLPSGELLVSYPTFHQVVCFTETDEGVVWRYGIQGSGKGELKEPSYLTSLPNGNIIISDSGNHRLVEINGKGFFMRHLAARGTAPGRLLLPRGILLDAEDFLFISDQGNNRVHIFQPGKSDLILREAKALIEKERWDDALPKIEQVLNLNPNSTDARGMLVNSLHFFGDRCFRKQEYEKAEEYYRRILMYNPNDPDIQPKLDTLFWASNRELIMKAALALGGVIAGLILLWMVKIIFQKLFFSGA